MPHPLQILLVDDCGDVCRALSMLLERDGHRVRTASDGASAIDEARQLAPDVVLLDIGLPGVNGYGVARALKTIPECSSTFIIALTGYAQPADRERSAATGFDLHILKPVDPHRLLALLKELGEQLHDSSNRHGSPRY